MVNSMIYFIQSLDKIKVGYTTDIEQRKKSLTIGNPHGLVVIGTIKGTKEHESKIHRKLKDHHVSGEWFNDNSNVRKYIEDILNKKVDIKYKTKHIMFTDDLSHTIETRSHKTEDHEWLGAWQELHDIRSNGMGEISAEVKKIELKINQLLAKKKRLEEKYIKMVKGIKRK